MGDARLVIENKYLVLNNVYFIPGFYRNLIPISKLHEQSYGILFYENGIVISRNGLDICHACMENRLYILKPYEQISLNTDLFNVAKP